MPCPAPSSLSSSVFPLLLYHLPLATLFVSCMLDGPSHVLTCDLVLCGHCTVSALRATHVYHLTGATNAPHIVHATDQHNDFVLIVMRTLIVLVGFHMLVIWSCMLAYRPTPCATCMAPVPSLNCTFIPHSDLQPCRQDFNALLQSSYWRTRSDARRLASQSGRPRSTARHDGA